MQPAAAERFGGFHRLVEIAPHHQWPANTQFAGLAVGHLVAVGIHKPDSRVGHRTAAGGKPLVGREILLVAAHDGNRRHRFGLAVELEEDRSEEPTSELQALMRNSYA